MFGGHSIFKTIIICLSFTLVLCNASWADDAKETKATDVQYTGVYQERQLIPNIMAIHCKMNGEDVAKDLNKLEKCLRQYIMEMNAENAITAQDGKKDYNNLTYSALNDLLSASMTKAASINGFEKKMTEYTNANSSTDTKFDTETALTNTIAFSTDVKNSLRDLYIENLKYNVVQSIGVITPEVFEDEVTEEDDKKDDETPKADKKE